MHDTLPNLGLPHGGEWVDAYDKLGIVIGTPLTIQSLSASSVKISTQAATPEAGDGYQLILKGQSLTTGKNSNKIWLSSQSGGAINVSLLPSLAMLLHDGFGNPISSLSNAVDIHDACVHKVPVNELFHRHTGIITTIATAVTAGDTSITVADGSAFTNSNPFQIEDLTKKEVTFPTIISGGGTNTFILDRPIDNNFAVGSTLEEVSTNLAVVGSLASPVSFQLIPDIEQMWHIVRFLIAMVHDTAADDSRFGNIAGGLQNGCILRAYNGTLDQYRTFTSWKSNFDVKMDMFDLAYTDKAGGGNFGTNGRGSIRDGTRAVPHLDDSAGDFLELLIQDDLSSLIKFNLKGQGHIEGL